MTTVQQTVWDERADVAQHSLDHFFGAEGIQLLHNSHPAGDDATFNYWWLAHLVDARLDAFERTGDAQWLAKAEAASRNIRERNDGSLFNDYFDDMLWYALAILRLYDATGDAQHLADARSIWEHVVEHGWNDTMGASIAWRKQQLYYKNTPANGPFVILSARLAAHDDPRYLDRGLTSYRWLTDTLVQPDGFVEDGINREEDGAVDLHWRFTYNQGLYVGAAVALAQATGDRAYLDAATKTALTALRELSHDGLFRQEGGAGGDEGLFKGVYYRYIGTLLEHLDPADAAAATLDAFVRSSTDALWESAQAGEWLRAGDDWSTPAPEKIDFSTQLSAIMALELRAIRERGAVRE